MSDDNKPEKQIAVIEEAITTKVDQFPKWKVGTIHRTNSGDLVILERLGNARMKVKFLYTGTIMEARTQAISLGVVKDPNLPVVYGVGFLGQGKYRAKVKGRMTAAYRCWAGILDRCHGKQRHIKAPTYSEVTIAPEWYNYQVFAEWFYANRPKDYKQVKYELDKDILSGENKIYSPSTCSFVTRQANVEAAWAKHYKFLSPEGNLECVYNLNKFCRGTELNSSHMGAVHAGKYKSHKGWTKYKEDENGTE